jgi:hypothetical protein
MHWSKLINEELPIKNGSRREFSQWAVDAHNKVNQRLGKPNVSYEEALNKYSPWYAQCPSEDPKPCVPSDTDTCRAPIYWIVLGLVVLGLLLAVLGFFIGKNSSRKK